MVKKKCLVCGMKFEPRSGHQKTCSEKCRKERIRERGRINARRLKERQRKAEEAGTELKGWRSERACIVCGEKFKPTNPPQKICSDECRAERRRVKTRERSAKYRQRAIINQGIREKDFPKVEKERIEEFEEIRISDLYRHVFKDAKEATKLAPISETILEETAFRYYFESGNIECYRRQK